ncbi:hypothetical protein OPS28_08605 [Alteromonas ponticola]|nr:hypothetical protein [Alteromonas sp. ASW11-130]
MTAALLTLSDFTRSILGECNIPIRLFRRDNLPPMVGSYEFIKSTRRFAWHNTSLAWFGFAGFLLFQQYSPLARLNTISAFFTLSAHRAAYLTKGKHFSLLLFAGISILMCLSTKSG